MIMNFQSLKNQWIMNLDHDSYKDSVSASIQRGTQSITLSKKVELTGPKHFNSDGNVFIPGLWSLTS